MAAKPERSSVPTEGFERLTGGYRPLPGVFDEMIAPDGNLRPHWLPFLRRFAGLGDEETGRRFSAADRHLKDSGVFYRVYEDPAGTERAWPFSHLPLVIDAADWRGLETGLIQRARLIEAVLADVYGRATLLRDGHLPASVIAGSPEFLRPMVGGLPRGGTWLRQYAVDVARGPDGRWWVLGDRAQAPSGYGYALENRLAMQHGLPDIHRALGVRRLAPFFQAMQTDLAALNTQDDSRVCVLTPGPLNETYFEHAYLARYLGFLLVEGEDLTVRDGGVFLRTVSGLRRVEVLQRRLDADFADPLELNARSRLGIPGLVQAARDGHVAVANALGSGLVEARAWLAFLPALARTVLGEDLAIPNVATWWLGDPHVRHSMMHRLDEMVVAPAFSDTDANGLIGDGLLGAGLDGRRRERIVRAMEDRGVDFVMQEPVGLSSMPVWQDGVLWPRPFVLRVLLARHGDEWRVMPGGFVRIAEGPDPRAVGLQRGGRTADAWVLADGPVAPTTLLPVPENIAIRRSIGLLPSRAAENLYWLGRYVERAEATARLVRALISRAGDDEPGSDTPAARIAALLVSWDAAPSNLMPTHLAQIARMSLCSPDAMGALPQLVASARSAAAVIRDRLSPDAWRALNRLIDAVAAPLSGGAAESVILERTDLALRVLSSFAGLEQENMTRLGGWRFLELGRRMERAITVCRYARRFADGADLAGTLDVLLELCDSQITYRQRYVMVAARAPAIDLVALDPANPRSLAFQVDSLEQHLMALPHHGGEDVSTGSAHSVVAATATRLRAIDADALDDAEIAGIERALLSLSGLIAAAYFTHSERAKP